jgi:hypothetical protein
VPSPSVRCPPSVVRFLNTTKCDSEKLSTKLAPIAITLATVTGTKNEASQSVAVLPMNPATPYATNET